MLDYAADLEDELRGLAEPPILIGHSMGGLLAQMLAARMNVRALVLLAPSAPWGVLPSTAFEIASAQALYLAGDFWNRALEPTQLDRGSQFARSVAASRTRCGVRPLRAGIGPAPPSRSCIGGSTPRAPPRSMPRSVAAPVLCLVGEKRPHQSAGHRAPRGAALSRPRRSIRKSPAIRIG